MYRIRPLCPRTGLLTPLHRSGVSTPRPRRTKNGTQGRETPRKGESMYFSESLILATKDLTPLTYSYPSRQSPNPPHRPTLEACARDLRRRLQGTPGSPRASHPLCSVRNSPSPPLPHGPTPAPAGLLLPPRHLRVSAEQASTGEARSPAAAEPSDAGREARATPEARLGRGTGEHPRVTRGSRRTKSPQRAGLRRVQGLTGVKGPGKVGLS